MLGKVFTLLLRPTIALLVARLLGCIVGSLNGLSDGYFVLLLVCFGLGLVWCLVRWFHDCFSTLPMKYIFLSWMATLTSDGLGREWVAWVVCYFVYDDEWSVLCLGGSVGFDRSLEALLVTRGEVYDYGLEVNSTYISCACRGFELGHQFCW